MPDPETEKPIATDSNAPPIAGPRAPNAVIKVNDLSKRYGKLEAVRGISFEVHRGEIFGIVGPNGAGKTTTVEIVEGLRTFNSGTVSVLGLHPQKDANKLKQRIGIQLQESILPDRIKVREALNLFSALYDRSAPWDTLVEQLGLNEKLNAYYDSLSGGQKQRLSIAMALLNDPEIVFFDELTTGLDPQARRAIWELVREVRDMGKTVILVTHFMEEAERLCDRVAIIDNGKLIALDAPRQLIQNLKAGFHLHFHCPEQRWQDKLQEMPSVARAIWEEGQYILEVQTLRGVGDIIHFITDQGVEYTDFTITQPNLEDVFIALTGRTIRD